MRARRVKAILAVAGLLLAGCQLTHDSASPRGGVVRGPSLPDSPAGPAARDAQALDVQIALARTLEQQRDPERAAALYQAIIERRPKDGTAHHRLAIIRDRQERFDESAELFRRALELRPDDPELLCDYGYSLYLQHRWGEAETKLKEALRLQPNHRRAHNHLGLVLTQLDRRDEALAEFQKGGCTAAQARMNLAFVLTLNDRFDEARQEYKAAIQSGPVPQELRTRLKDLDAALAGRDTPGNVQLTSGAWSEPVGDSGR